MKRKRFLAFGDVHGAYVNLKAFAKLLAFKRSFEPHIVICLGDLVDFSALRRGATEEDCAMSLDDDLDAGLSVLKEMEPRYYFLGNHEYRIYERRLSPYAVMREFAREVVRRIENAAKITGTEVVEYDRRKGVREIGMLRFLHGYYHGVNAATQHAMVYGDCVFGHIHAYSVASAPRWGVSASPAVAVSSPRLCVDIGYMAKLAGTLRQESGWVYGEITERSYHVEAARESQGYVVR